MIQMLPMTAAEIAARDAARSATLAGAGLDPARATPDLHPTAVAMAGHMIDIAALNGGACRDVELKLRGFTDAELAEHGAAANRLALGCSGGRA
ncbi:hypothetical protein NPA31_007335 [Aurantimonas sp. MSK8Z-1]|uniref:hypothetical protein n=1 Tax=Mangrovibrevibacter kandeliae TaxID=2968473 RepID=UPI0021187969|nr:hypothetical protein [Aurantimonas sp. MSK8Z-1]MCW4114775.1 hypothetical protein [Aurantimonas sp. MSK8Z-1]